jgi:uncharacterized membrane protein
MIKIKIPYLITVIVSILLIFIGHKYATDGIINFQNTHHETTRGRVQRIVDRVTTGFDFTDDFFDEYYDLDNEFDNLSSMPHGEKIIFEVRISSGARRGELVLAEQTFSPFLLDRSKEVSRGDNVLLVNNQIGWFFGGYYRINRLIWLGVFFVFFIFLFGRKKGLNTLLSLGLICAAIFAVFIPSILSGKNIYLMAILVCLYNMVTTPLIVMGYNKKSLAAIAGCTGGVMIAGLIALIMDKSLHLTGVIDQHSRFLLNLPGDLQLNLNAVIFAGIIIGAMGAVMDVAVSISSSLWEIKEKARNLTFKVLFRSGINIGRDIMGTMADTLVLAYIGSSLSVVILLTVFSGSLMELFNSEMIAVEILQAVAGSFGILFAMPLTALFCSLIYLRNKGNNR